MNEYKAYISRIQTSYEVNKTKEVPRPRQHPFQIDQHGSLALHFHPHSEDVGITTSSKRTKYAVTINILKKSD